jgi:hypothetical protein
MPITPKNRGRDPKNWPQIRVTILARAGHRCEGSPAYPDCRAVNHQSHPGTGSRVVLTIAHLDHLPEPGDETNVKAWCQRCHLTYDAAHHLRTRRGTRDATQRPLEETCNE